MVIVELLPLRVASSRTGRGSVEQEDLSGVGAVWETLAKEDPLWAILSHPEKLGRKWTPEEFFREGETEISALMATLDGFGYPFYRGLALDFGCGVGRLSQALAAYCQGVVGIDISENMLELARSFNRFGSRVEYIHNTTNSLKFLDNKTFDLVYSNLVLQHMPPEDATSYIREFLRIAKPGGYVVFQVPSHLREDYLPAESTETALAESICRARLRLVSAPTVVAAGESTTVEVEVSNESNQDWIQRRVLVLHLGSHWVDKGTPSSRTRDEGNARLPGRVPAGARVKLTLPVTAPLTPGDYRLELDVVQEGVRWFRDVGSPTLNVPIRVAAKPASSDGVQMAQPQQPSVNFVMNGVRREVVEQIIALAGAQLLLAQEHRTEWYSYMYYVRR